MIDWEKLSDFLFLVYVAAAVIGLCFLLAAISLVGPA